MTVYTTGIRCQRCRLTRIRLEELGVPYREIDLTDDANRAAREFVTDDLGYSEAPVVVVDAEPENHWSGFQPDRIDRLAGGAVATSRRVEAAARP
ncbi:glutaredoxin family protein [Microbacterium sp. 2FI]|uniref:glutaredoxin family protein n=1 Tax=Microbacterium sp. 2FI TaxID=2502193 RepID=UPI002017D9DC|nr:glutaredoxin family protein [Microbacterium sp. 2FI]